MNSNFLAKVFEKGYLLGLSDSTNGIYIKLSDITENFISEWEEEPESTYNQVKDDLSN